MSQSESSQNSNFLRAVIQQDIADNKHEGRVVTRFPPEPNGYLHIGHARSIWLNFGLAKEFGGECNLRFDDTNPEKEDQEYIDAIKEDVRWLGYEWAGEAKFASSYFDTFYEWALHLINEGKAYVCHLSPEQASEYRGWATSPGKESPYRDRTVEENLQLFEKMRAGEFAEGECVLRAKIDMASPNMNLRDPILYRIRKIAHHQTGDKWCIYPSYDFAHGQEDAIEGVTHSICTLEFQAHRPLYEWFIENLPVPSTPRQYEFGRLNLNYTVTSKRKLKKLVDDGVVSGWDDPRMPTVSGMRRRGFTPRSIANFCDMIPVSGKGNSDVDVAQLEHAIRDDLNEHAPRAMCVMEPLRVVITNLAEDHRELLSAPYHPDKDLGERVLPFTREIYIDAGDFKEEYSKKFKKKLTPGKRIRLRNAYVIQAEDYETDESGKVVQVNATLVPNTLGIDPEDGDKPKGVAHWVSASEAVPAELRIYERLFTDENPDQGDKDFMDFVNQDSLRVTTGMIEPGIANCEPEMRYQFEREGYFVADRYDHKEGKPVFNLTIGLRSSI